MENFHKKSQSVRNNGTYLLGDLANMDQTPLPCVMDDGKTYDKTGALTKYGLHAGRLD